MDAPPPQEDVVSYIAVSELLRRLGFSAPEVFAEDRARGFLLIEDFGDDTYTRLLDRGADEPALYALAVDTLVELQRAVGIRGVTELARLRSAAASRRDGAFGRLVCPGRFRGPAVRDPARGISGFVAHRSCRKQRSPKTPWCCAITTSTT